jgi:DNA-binding transcriptional MerR regulator
MPPLMAFTAETVRRLTGLSDRQLRYWDKTGFFSPSLADENRRRPHSRIYSFRDLVGLRTIALLLERGISLQGLRRIGGWLADRHEAPWSELRFYAVGKEVFVGDPDTGTIVATDPKGQTVMRYYLEEIAEEMAEATERLQVRTDDQIGKIVRNRFVMQNEPVLEGTRIPTAAIWDFHAAGYDTKAIIDEYPRLTPIDVERAIAFEKERRCSKAAG